MATWNELLNQFAAIPNPATKVQWLNTQMHDRLLGVGRLRGDTNVMLYGSAFLQKPQAPAPNISISPEDIDGLMAVVHGMDWNKGLSLVLHTPGGVTNATETIVAYLRSKFPTVEAIVPTYAMSAGTMIALACERVVMSRPSQLGPIDPQMGVGGRNISARAIVEQFERARLEVVGDKSHGIDGDLLMAHVWAPVLATIGPALLVEAQNALDYSERMVAQWLSDYMFAGVRNRKKRGLSIAQHFNDASKHLSHGRRIDRNEARKQGVVVEDLEDSQDLQEEVMSLYHIMTIAFQSGSATKMMAGTTGGRWVKNWIPPNTPGMVIPGALPSAP